MAETLKNNQEQQSNIESYKIENDDTIDNLATELNIPTNLVPNFEHAINEFVANNKPDWAEQTKNDAFILKAGKEISVEDIGEIMAAFKDLKLDADILTMQEKIFKDEAQQYLLKEGYTNIKFLRMKTYHYHEDKLHGQNPPEARKALTDVCDPKKTPNFNNAYSVSFYANSKNDGRENGENRLKVEVTIRDGKIIGSKIPIFIGFSG
jgi:hypothetical protein